MTDVMIRPMAKEKRPGGQWRYVRDPDGDCDNGTRHGPTEAAHREGCRCPQALAAHADYLARRRTRDNRQAPPAPKAPDGSCTALGHGTESAYRRRGCRCEDAIKAYHTAKERARIRHMRKRILTCQYDPRIPWRGPDHRVSRFNLLLLMGGFVDNPTLGERTVAALRLSRMPHRFGQWINTPDDVARIIGEYDGHQVTKLIARVERLRASRTRRRLADAWWRAARAERVTLVGRGHGRDGHPIHPLWMAAAYVALTDSAPNPGAPR